MKNKEKRNSFVALCKIASSNNWCWNIYCTTCGHGSFKVAFTKMIHGQQPDDKVFWPNGKENHALLKEIDQYNDFGNDSRTEDQIKLASIIAGAKISDIQAVARFPDWLGYIGLVIHHCPCREARIIITDSFLPQLINMANVNNELKKYFSEKQKNNELLCINDLSRIEAGYVQEQKEPAAKKSAEFPTVK